MTTCHQTPGTTRDCKRIDGTDLEAAVSRYVNSRGDSLWVFEVKSKCGGLPPALTIAGVSALSLRGLAAQLEALAQTVETDGGRKKCTLPEAGGPRVHYPQEAQSC